jgi:hypothetical protein
LEFLLCKASQAPKGGSAVLLSLRFPIAKKLGQIFGFLDHIDGGMVRGRRDQLMVLAVPLGIHVEILPV